MKIRQREGARATEILGVDFYRNEEEREREVLGVRDFGRGFGVDENWRLGGYKWFFGENFFEPCWFLTIISKLLMFFLIKKRRLGSGRTLISPIIVKSNKSN